MSAVSLRHVLPIPDIDEQYFVIKNVQIYIITIVYTNSTVIIQLQREVTTLFTMNYIVVYKSNDY